MSEELTEEEILKICNEILGEVTEIPKIVCSPPKLEDIDWLRSDTNNLEDIIEYDTRAE